ncbi:MAG TPA: lysozyme [Methylococcus sp.]|nr:lysozyme [Methylococcus sp.]
MKFRLLPASLTLSAAALVGIAVHEGYRERAYDDGVGVQTLGFGSTSREDGSPVRPSDRTDPVRALILLGAAADRKQMEMRECIGAVPLHQHEWDAFVSLAYNIGTTAFCRSTLVKKLKSQPPDYAGACREILKWTRAGGRELPGLVRRRQAEYRQCLGDAP